MSTSTETAAAYRTRSVQLLDLLQQVPADRWDRPSPCEEWTVRQVVEHLVESERDIVTRVDLELPPGRDPSDDPPGAMADVVAGMQEVLDDSSLAEREYDGAFGRTSLAATMRTFFVFDLSVHRWDIATGSGVGTTFDEEELDEIEAALDQIGDSIYEYGACRRIEAAADADRQTRVLARLGRDPAAIPG
jgi:uncharacterized protein (TIGR03086 family)